MSNQERLTTNFQPKIELFMEANVRGLKVKNLEHKLSSSISILCTHINHKQQQLTKIIFSLSLLIFIVVIVIISIKRFHEIPSLSTIKPHRASLAKTVNNQLTLFFIPSFSLPLSIYQYLFLVFSQFIKKDGKDFTF